MKRLEAASTLTDDVVNKSRASNDVNDACRREKHAPDRRHTIVRAHTQTLIYRKSISSLIITHPPPVTFNGDVL